MKPRPPAAPPEVAVEIYQTQRRPRRVNDTRPERPQLWRWRAKNAGNHKVLAIASEAYTNEKDCVDAVWQLFGAESNITLHHKGRVTPLQVAP